jgi:hypothetical protein
MKQVNTGILILTFLFYIVFCVVLFIVNRWENKAGWERTNRQNAQMSYWTMRTNAEVSRKLMSEESYEVLRQKIDADWRRLNPDLELPDRPEGK